MPGELLNKRPRLNNPKEVFRFYGVSKKDQAQYLRQIKAGRSEAAINAFHKKYIAKYINEFQANMQGYMYEAQIGEMSLADANKLQRNIAIHAARTEKTVTGNFRIFINDVFAPTKFEKAALKSAQLQRVILNDSLREFTKLTKDSMSNTAANVLAQTRKMQRQMVVRNYVLKKSGLEVSDFEEARFRDTLRRTNPDYFKAMEDGNIFKSRSFGADGERVINYRLDDYNAMATKQTLRNLDRTTVEVKARSNEEHAVEYFEEDKRSVDDEREICQEILDNDFNGRSLLALDDETADALGIMTLEQAREEGAMGPHCRHGIRPISESLNNRISDVIEEGAA